MTYKTLFTLWLQQCLLLLVFTVCSVFLGKVTAYSIAIGGIIYLIPNMYFGVYAFRYRGAQASQYVLLSFYRGEVGKFVLSCVGFGIVFTFVTPLNVFALFLMYIVLTIFQWIKLSQIRH